jgi:hypothetical protein
LFLRDDLNVNHKAIAGDCVMGWGKISKGKLGSIVSLKALALAFFLTPVTVAAPPLATPAAAQFYIGIPGIRFGGGGYYRHRGGGRSHSRHHRGGGDGGGDHESEATPSAPAAGKGPRGTSD